VHNEVELIRKRYAERTRDEITQRYSFVRPSVYLSVQERERALMRWIRKFEVEPLASRRVLEIGCGSGQNLLDFLRFGFRAENLVGNELLADRVEEARRRLPQSIPILEGNALELDLPENSFDVVFQSTVFSSILDAGVQKALASQMWRWVAPQGGVLWYDFTYDNPRNPHVRGVPVREIRTLFPNGHLTCWRITLAPPLARTLTRVHPALYSVANALPFLRTHVLCWIAKEQDRVRGVTEAS